eukprot:2521368-Pyramimonas_sp.AAC.1
MSRLYKSLQVGLSAYRDRRFEGTQEEYEESLRISTTVYVGNLSFYTTEEQIMELFSKVGDVKRIIIGLDKTKLTPCGFCFVAYYTRKDADSCVNILGGSILDERPIRVDIDWGFVEGRQFGRGKSGGQEEANGRCPSRICHLRSICRAKASQSTYARLAPVVTQVRDEYRTDFDVGRGGFGKI